MMILREERLELQFAASSGAIRVADGFQGWGRCCGGGCPCAAPALTPHSASCSSPCLTIAPPTPRLIPGLERSAGEGIGYPFPDSWASLVAQLVKNLPAMWETWVRSLGWEDPLEKGKATHSSILA